MNIVVLTGAGISQESGIPTFRGIDGLWEGRRVEDVASPIAFQHSPELVHRFYNMRRRHLLNDEVQPNAAHRALAEFEAKWDRGSFLLITQNVDDLHVRAGSKNILPMHGEILKVRCVDTGEVFDWREDLTCETPHPKDPSRLGRLRPHIVWFGEMPFGMDQMAPVLADCDCFIAIGTSGVVYPAAGLVTLTPADCYRVEINVDDTPVASDFTETIRDKATDAVPRFLDRLMTGELG